MHTIHLAEAFSPAMGLPTISKSLFQWLYVFGTGFLVIGAALSIFALFGKKRLHLLVHVVFILLNLNSYLALHFSPLKLWIMQAAFFVSLFHLAALLFSYGRFYRTSPFGSPGFSCRALGTGVLIGIFFNTPLYYMIDTGEWPYMSIVMMSGLHLIAMAVMLWLLYPTVAPTYLLSLKYAVCIGLMTALIGGIQSYIDLIRFYPELIPSYLFPIGKNFIITIATAVGPGLIIVRIMKLMRARSAGRILGA